jgi:hypothetical protein
MSKPFGYALTVRWLNSGDNTHDETSCLENSILLQLRGTHTPK